jgi:hypothetical protein
MPLAYITRDLLNSGTLQCYIHAFSVTGLTSNPTIFDHAIRNSTAYDPPIREKLRNGLSGEALFFELELEDLTRAAAMFLPVHDRTSDVDGGALEVSSLLESLDSGRARLRRNREPFWQWCQCSGSACGDQQRVGNDDGGPRHYRTDWCSVSASGFTHSSVVRAEAPQPCCFRGPTRRKLSIIWLHSRLPAATRRTDGAHPGMPANSKALPSYQRRFAKLRMAEIV